MVRTPYITIVMGHTYIFIATLGLHSVESNKWSSHCLPFIVNQQILEQRLIGVESRMEVDFGKQDGLLELNQYLLEVMEALQNNPRKVDNNKVGRMNMLCDLACKAKCVMILLHWELH